MDTFGKVDSYVSLKALKTRQVTEVHKKDYNPVYNHAFSPLHCLISEPIKIGLWDWDKNTAHDKIAKYSFTILKLYKKYIHGLPPNGVSATQIVLPVERNKAHGTLILDVEVTWPAELAPLSPVDKQRWIKSCKLKHVLNKIKCHDVFFEDLFTLTKFDIVLVCDDSGSMQSTVEPGKTRWDELKDTVLRVSKICCALDEDGVDLLFLNRGSSHVTKKGEIEHAFKSPPNGSTPLAQACASAFALLKQKPLLVLMATDGVPDNLAAFTEALKNRNTQMIYVSILACSDVESEIGYLDKLDQDVPNLDVLDDYKSERAQIGQPEYTKGDHCARILLGPVFPKYDKLDEMKFTPFL